MTNPLAPHKPGGETRNDRDLYLLHNDPKQLVVEYQETIRIMVSSFTRNGMFRFDDLEEITQATTEQFLKYLPRITQQFNGSVLVRTYITAVLRNICLDIRSTPQFDPSRATDLIDTKYEPADRHSFTESRLYIRQEVETLRAILAQYGRKRPKLELLLKIRYQMPVSLQDILAWYPGCPAADRETLLKAYGKKWPGPRTGELLAPLAPILSRVDGKTSNPDAIRRWLLLQVEEIVELLNGSPPISTHTNETLGTLLSEYFFPFSILEPYRG